MPVAKSITIGFTVLLVGVVAAFFGLIKETGLSARKKPGAVERAVATYALHLSIPQAAKNTRNPVAASPEALTAGSKNFAENCAICHGVDGAGKTDTARGLSPGVPDLRSKKVQKLTDGQMFYLVKNGIRFTGMPGWDLSEDQIWKLVLVMRQFPRGPISPQPVSKGS